MQKSLPLNIICVTIYLVLSIIPLQAAPTFTMAFGHDPKINPQYKFYEQLYTQAFKKLGYTFKYKVFPSIRATKMTTAGLVDGEPQRIFNYGNKHNNLIRIDEPIFENRTFAFTGNQNIKLESLQDLNNTNFRVDYLRGSKWSKAQLSTLVPQDKLSPLNTVKQGFKKLLFDRTDIFVCLEVYALSTLATKEFRNSGIISLGVVGSNLSYPYIHKSHKQLAKKLATIIKTMKENGQYYKILKETMPFMPGP